MINFNWTKYTNIYTACHSLDYKERQENIEFGKPVSIGGSVVILPGVTIGDNAVIGAGSVVTKDILATSIAVGNPCKILEKEQKNEKN